MCPVNSEEFVPGSSVQHKTRILHDARVKSVSKSGKRIGVLHNISHPYGVCWNVTYFKREQLK